MPVMPATSSENSNRIKPASFCKSPLTISKISNSAAVLLVQTRNWTSCCRRPTIVLIVQHSRSIVISAPAPRTGSIRNVYHGFSLAGFNLRGVSLPTSGVSAFVFHQNISSSKSALPQPTRPWPARATVDRAPHLGQPAGVRDCVQGVHACHPLFLALFHRPAICGA